MKDIDIYYLYYLYKDYIYGAMKSVHAECTDLNPNKKEVCIKLKTLIHFCNGMLEKIETKE